MKTRRILSLVLFLLFLASCAGNAPNTEDPPPPLIRVGFSQVGSESDWRLANTKSMTNALSEENGFELLFDNARQKQENQFLAIRNFIQQEVDYIVIAPISEYGWDSVLTEARDAGIPVIIMDRMIETDDDDLYTAYIGADFLAEGRRAGKYLLKKADALGAEHMNIVEITGTEDSTPMRDRQAGFRWAIEGDDRFTIVESVTGDFLRSKGEECMRYLLDKYGPEGIDVVYSHNDEMTLGALKVLEAEGIDPGKDIILISVDAQQEAIDALKAGRINCIVECTPDLGNSVMEMVDALTKGKQIPKRNHPVERAFTEFDNLSEVGPRGY